MAPLLLGFVPRAKELNLPLSRFNLVLVLLEFLLCSDVRIRHRLKRCTLNEYAFDEETLHYNVTYVIKNNPVVL